jgi:hypothetical protein
MNRLLFFCLILFLILLNSCDRKDDVPGDFFTAIIDGKKFTAKYIYINRQTSDKSISIHASSVNLLDKNLTNEKILKNPDYKFFEISFCNDCLDERIFTWAEISADTSCVGFLYLFNDTTDHPEIKGFSSLMMHTYGTIQIEFLDNKKDGSIIGNFEVSGMNYNEINFTDTIHINHGSFRFHFEN